MSWDLSDRRNFAAMAQFEFVCFKVSDLMMFWKKKLL
jgi:hypothetical protein